MLAQRILHGACNGQEKQYVDDVFSTYLYTGNGSTQTITNGIDLAGKGGLVWIKQRNSTENHFLFDTARTATYELNSNTIDASTALANSLTAFNSNGFSVGSASTAVNTNTSTYASWTFRKAAKFFDVVTYTGNGTSSRTIAHKLGQEVGMVMTKSTSTTGDWNTYHRSATGDLILNSTAAQTASKAIVNSATSTTFTVSGAANTTTVTYVAYLFAHDTAADGIIQCGSFSGNTAVSLGWEPQYIMYKRTDSTGNWITVDSMRGIPTGGVDQELYPNVSNAEAASVSDYINLTATGFTTTNLTGTFVYLAIRRPNKPPTSGTQVYNAIARTGTGAAATVTGVGFAPDLYWVNRRSANVERTLTVDRLRGSTWLFSNVTAAETTNTTLFPVNPFSVSMDGVRIGSGDNLNNFYTYIDHFFRRAPGFFDVVAYTGTGVARTVPHGLGVAPELMIVKKRNGASNWHVYNQHVGNGKTMYLQATNAPLTSSTYWNNTSPTDAVFTVGTNSELNEAGSTYVAYLFATLAGVSKVGSYTGNGTSQTINCGFSTGARFILIKRTDSTGDWYVWDSARGIVAANDPHLSLNTTAAEVTADDSIDPDSTGFIVNQNTATNINVTGGSYIFLAIA